MSQPSSPVSTRPTRVLRMSPGARAGIASLGGAFLAMVIGLLIFSVTHFRGGSLIGLTAFIAVTAVGLSWTLWRLLTSRVEITAGHVVLRYGFFPTVRLDRGDIIGVELRPMNYLLMGGGIVDTPVLITGDGARQPVYLCGRRGTAAAMSQLALLRGALGLTTTPV